MDNIQKRYGYTGQGLRVNLTTGKITKEPTFPRFKDEIGGTALGYRVFWDEVPPKTQPLDEANKLVIAPGPFSGSGTLLRIRRPLLEPYFHYDHLSDNLSDADDCLRSYRRRHGCTPQTGRL